jgi:serine protease DegS
MKLYRVFSFIFTSVATGLAAAFIVLLIRPDLMQYSSGWNPKLTAPAKETQLPRKTGPVSYAEAVQHASPSVVNVFATKIKRNEPHPLFDDPMFKRFFGNDLSTPRTQQENSLGSGVVIDDNGYILTNNHVISGASDIQVVIKDGRRFPARIVGTDPETDLAVLQAAISNTPIANLGDSENLQVGDVVMAIGNPFGVGQTVTLGIISATGRSQLGITDFENFIQTDAAINPGNSGGALINAQGDVIGINTAIFSKSGGSHGIGFAIPVNLARQVMQQIAEHGRVIRGWIGINGQNLTPALAESLGIKNQQGILVSGVLRQGPAAQAGIQPGDVLLEVDGNAVYSASQMLKLVAAHQPGDEVAIKLQRQGDTEEINVAVMERPPHRLLSLTRLTLPVLDQYRHDPAPQAVPHQISQQIINLS